MKTIKILTYPVNLDRILSALSSKGIEEVVTTEVKQFGSAAQAGTYRGIAYPLRATTKIAIEFTAAEFAAHDVIEAVLASSSDHAGQGLRVFVSTSEEVASVAEFDRYLAHA